MESDELLTLDRGRMGGGARRSSFGGGGNARRWSGGGMRRSGGGGRRSNSIVTRRAPIVGSLRGPSRPRRFSGGGGVRYPGRRQAYRHRGYRPGFWARRRGFYPFGYGAYWFGRYRWLPYYYGLYAYNYYPTLWTPLYVPIAETDYTGDPRLVTDERSYMRNPELPTDTELPPQELLPVFEVDTSVMRVIGDKRKEDLRPYEEARIKDVFSRIDAQHAAVVQRLRRDGQYDYWVSRGFRIVPDLDRNRFVWVRDDSAQQQRQLNTPSSPVVLNHYYKELEGRDMLYEEGYLFTQSGDVYEYSVEHPHAVPHHTSLDEKMACAMWLGRLVNTESLTELHDTMGDQHDTTSITKREATDDALTSNECEFLVGYHSGEAMPRILYGMHGNNVYHNDTATKNLRTLYSALEWHSDEECV